MDADRFDKVVRAFPSRLSRRGLAGLLSGLTLGGSLALVELSDATAKKKRRRRKGGGGGGASPPPPPPPSPPPPPPPPPPVVTPSLATCRSTCGEGCPCLFGPDGEISCGNAGTRGVCTRCQSGSDCPFGTCFAGFYAVGQSTVSRLGGCDYPSGICADLSDCAG